MSIQYKNYKDQSWNLTQSFGGAFKYGGVFKALFLLQCKTEWNYAEGAQCFMGRHNRW